MKKIKLDIVGLSYSQTQSGAYALVLGEVGGNRRLPIIIGSSEAQAIAMEIEKMTPSRPLTHDLFKTFADTFNISLQEVLIYNLIDGVFFAKIIAKSGKNICEIDSRTSDAVALAVRFGCPIYTYEFVMDTAGIVIESNDFAFLDNMATTEKAKQEVQETDQKESNISTEEDTSSLMYASYSTERLEVELQKAIDSEQYEIAARLRDEIERRK